MKNIVSPVTATDQTPGVELTTADKLHPGELVYVGENKHGYADFRHDTPGSYPVEVRHVEPVVPDAVLVVYRRDTAVKTALVAVDTRVARLTGDAAESWRVEQVAIRRRAELAAGVMALADWLTTTRHAPIGSYGGVTYSYYVSNNEAVDDTTGPARVREIAEAIGGVYHRSNGTHHYATRTFSGDVTYQAVYIASEERADAAARIAAQAKARPSGKAKPAASES